jgi:hypothetical protein
MFRGPCSSWLNCVSGRMVPHGPGRSWPAFAATVRLGHLRQSIHLSATDAPPSARPQLPDPPER